MWVKISRCSRSHVWQVDLEQSLLIFEVSQILLFCELSNGILMFLCNVEAQVIQNLWNSVCFLIILDLLASEWFSGVPGGPFGIQGEVGEIL